MTKKEMLDFFDAESTVMLTTMDAGIPQTRAMGNVRNASESRPDLAEFFKTNNRIFFTACASDDKIAQIAANDAANVYCFNDKGEGLLLTGRIVTVEDDDIRDALWGDGVWEEYFKGGKAGYTVLEFIPARWKYNAADMSITRGDFV